MKRSLTSLCLLCLSLLAVLPVKAWTVDPACSAQRMLSSTNDSGWKSPYCYVELINYIESLGSEGPRQCRAHKEVIGSTMEGYSKQQVGYYYSKGDQENWNLWRTAREGVLAACHFQSREYCWTYNSNTCQYSDKHYYTVEEQVQKQVELKTALDKIVEVLPGWPRNQAWSELAAGSTKVERLQGLLDLMLSKVRAGEDLTPFIELIVNEGKPNKADPHHVSDDVINTAFLLYAYSIPADHADKILTYTDGKYAARVRFAAAQAASQFAKDHVNNFGRTVVNEPAGRLVLNSAQRNKILSVFQPIYQSFRTTMLTKALLASYVERIYDDPYGKLERQSGQRDGSLAAFAPAIVLGPTVAESLAAAAQAYAASIGAEAATGIAALEGTLASGATATFGQVLVVAVPVVVFGVALDDAFAPTYRTIFENKLRESLRVETIPAATVMEDAYTQAFDGTYMVETLTNTRTEAATKTQVQQTTPCIHQYSSQMNVACPSFEAIPLQGTFMEAYAQNPALIQSKFITGGASQGALRLALQNPAELAQLEQIWQERCSFMTKVPTGAGTQSTRRGFVRATYYAGRWIPTVEASIMTGINIDRNGGVNDQGGPSKKNLPMKKFLAFIKSWANADWTNLTYGIMKRQNFKPQQVGNVWVRNGIHQDRSKPTPDHIHIEKICAYTPGSAAVEMCQFNPTAPSIGTNLYQCNLSLQYK